jgi:uncharacterized protein (TIGR00730 family)
VKLQSVCVYCGSFSSAKQVYKDAAVETGRRLGESGLSMVYGGGNVGLMGLTADSAIRAGAKVVGIIPTFITSREPQHPGLTELVEVGDMHTRKRFMAERSDGFLILPGGFGTLDEFAEILTWRQLGLHQKPIVAVNINGFWDNLRRQLDYMLEEGFIKPQHRALVGFVDTVKEALPLLKQMVENTEVSADGPKPAHDEVKDGMNRV